MFADLRGWCLTVNSTNAGEGVVLAGRHRGTACPGGPSDLRILVVVALLAEFPLEVVQHAVQVLGAFFGDSSAASSMRPGHSAGGQAGPAGATVPDAVAFWLRPQPGECGAAYRSAHARLADGPGLP